MLLYCCGEKSCNNSSSIILITFAIRWQFVSIDRNSSILMILEDITIHVYRMLKYLKYIQASYTLVEQTPFQNSLKSTVFPFLRDRGKCGPFSSRIFFSTTWKKKRTHSRAPVRQLLARSKPQNDSSEAANGNRPLSIDGFSTRRKRAAVPVLRTRW